MFVSLLTMGGCREEVRLFSGLKPDHPPAWTAGCATVTTLQPTLRWQTLAAREAKEQEPSVSRVTYDLRIWLAAHDSPSTLVYAREGLRCAAIS